MTHESPQIARKLCGEVKKGADECQHLLESNRFNNENYEAVALLYACCLIGASCLFLAISLAS